MKIDISFTGLKITFFTFVMFIACGEIYAASYSTVTTIKGLVITPELVRVIVGNTVDSNYEACANIDDKRYAFDPREIGGKEKLSVLLTAKTTSSKVTLRADDCIGTTSKLNHIFFCDSYPC